MPDPSATRPPVLTVACSDGLYEIDGTTSRAIRAAGDGTFRTSVTRRSSVDPTRLWVGMFDGLASFRYVDGRWIDEGLVPGINDEVRSLFENADGSLWAGTAGTGVLRVSFTSRPAPGEPRPPVTIERFGVAHGLPEGGAQVLDIAGTPLFFVGTEEQYLARFDAPSGRFVRDAVFAGMETDPLQSTFGAANGRDGRVYLDFGRGTIVAQKTPDGTWAMDRTAFARFGPGTNTLYPEPRWRGLAGARRQPVRAVRHEPRVGCRASDVFRPDQARHREQRPPVLRRRRRRIRPTAARRGLQCLADRVCRSRLRRRVHHRVPVQTRRPRDRLVGVDPRSPARLHQPGLRRLPLPRPRAWSVGRGERRGRLRVHDPARPGIARGWPTAATSRCWSASSSLSTGCNGAASWAGSGSARALRKRSCAPNRPRRWRARRAKARRTSSCSARSAARSPRRSTSTRSSASSTSA